MKVQAFIPDRNVDTVVEIDKVEYCSTSNTVSFIQRGRIQFTMKCNVAKAAEILQKCLEKDSLYIASVDEYKVQGEQRQ